MSVIVKSKRHLVKLFSIPCNPGSTHTYILTHMHRYKLIFPPNVSSLPLISGVSEMTRKAKGL